MLKIPQLCKLLLLVLAFLSSPINADEIRSVTLTLKSADIHDLIAWAQDLTDKPLIIHPQVSGSVTVIAREPMTQNEAFSLFTSVLAINGYRILESNDSIKIIPDNKGIQAATQAHNQLPHTPAHMIVEVVALHYIKAASLVPILKPLASEQSIVAANTDSNTLLIIDSSENLIQLKALIKKFDVKKTSSIERYALKHIDAQEIANTLIKVIGDQSQLLEPVTIIPESRSNTLFISGNITLRKEISELIRQLDTPSGETGNTHVIFLNYAIATELVPLLQGIVQTQTAEGKSNTQTNIQADKGNNAIIVTAPPSIQSNLQEIISTLDIRKSQVLVEAIIAEVNGDITDAFGVEWRTPTDGKDWVGGFTNFPAPASPLSRNSNTGEISLGSGLSLGFLQDMDFRALVSLLRGQAESNILSTPTLMALDNEEAQILVGENVPFVVGSRLAQGDDTPFQTIQRQDIGISLKLKPQINQHGSVALNIEQKVESISASEVQASDIITNKREIKTRVLVDDQKILVLGGLMRDELQISESRVPLLSSIPILGRLFRSTKQTSVKRNLLVFLRPTILEDSSISAAVSKDKYDLIRKAQQRFNAIKDRALLMPQADGPVLESLEPQ